MTNLKADVETKQRQNIGYTQTEYVVLRSGLKFLKKNVPKLMKKLENDGSGDPDQLKKVVKPYVEYEAEYRHLRSLHKTVKLRYKTKQQSDHFYFDLCEFFDNLFAKVSRILD